MNEIYVIGHHNPDTDSIVSAMAYAALRNALGDRNYVAAHMDHISDQTQRMLDRFGFQPPRTVQNVRTQVEDLDYDTPPALNATVTMDRAWHIMREQKISAIPVINEDGTLYGTLSAGDIATYSMTTIANPRVEAVPLFNLLSVIEGRLLNDSGDLIDTVSGNVVIALPQSCENLLFGDPDNIVICGDQPDMIRRALDIGVSCLILCQTEVDPDLLENAGRTCIITTPYEASRVARLIYQASPISRPCHNDKIVCFHLSDYIDDVREVVLKSRYRCYPVLDENEKVVGTLSRYHLLRPRRKRVVLVDHHWRISRPASPSGCATSPWAALPPSSPVCTRSTASCPRPIWRGCWRRPSWPTPLCSSPPPAPSGTLPWPSVWPASAASTSRSWAASCSPPPEANPWRSW